MRKLYDEVKSKRYGTPEKRDVRQLVLKTDKEAEEALARLKGGMDIDALAAELKLNPKDVDLGFVEQRDFGDAKVGAAVFALTQPGLAEPVHTAFGTVVSQVKKHYARRLRPRRSSRRRRSCARKSPPSARRRKCAPAA